MCQKWKFYNLRSNLFSFRLLSMRMPRTSSFSVRDILDLGPKQGQEEEAVADTKLPNKSLGELIFNVCQYF